MTVKKSAWTSLPVQMMIGLVLGVVVGMFISSDFATTYLKPLGDLFIRLIRMVVVPLVFATLVAGAAGISDISKLGRVAIKNLDSVYGDISRIRDFRLSHRQHDRSGRRSDTFDRRLEGRTSEGSELYLDLTQHRPD